MDISHLQHLAYPMTQSMHEGLGLVDRSFLTSTKQPPVAVCE